MSGIVVCDFVVLLRYVFHVCLNFGVIYGVGVPPLARVMGVGRQQQCCVVYL